ncbi:hypothetical protein M9H77_17791 [Catharanthus roseus]|uniref:Uncharacterized protein n=1 Tax=Catharanthus roseus TaxID=4058 RepID=A0ACC0B5L4_CATRO|nr:hypothetical protein M9H77_17791 [Catharanthus roseus]
MTSKSRNDEKGMKTEWKQKHSTKRQQLSRMAGQPTIDGRCREWQGNCNPRPTTDGRTHPCAGGSLPIFLFLSALPIAPKKIVASLSNSKSKRARVERTSPNPTPNVLHFPNISQTLPGNGSPLGPLLI